MKGKFVALLICTALLTASWMGFARPAQGITMNGPELSWLGNDNIIKAIIALFGPPDSTTNVGSKPSTDSNTDGSKPSTGNTGGTTDPGTTGNTGGTINPGTPTGNTGSTTNPGTTTGNTGSNTNTGTTPLTTNEKNYQKYMSHYQSHEVPLIDAYRQSYNGSLAQALVGRAIWYMEHGYMVYGHQKYWDTGYIDCSNFVSLVYKDFGYTITSAARKYTTVGTKVTGVSAKKQSNGKYALVGVDKLRPGDIFTYWAKDSDGTKYISHVALYMGLVNGKPAVINTRKEHPTAIGIVNDFSYWYGENLYDVRRVLPDSAQTANTVNVKSLSSPVIPAKYQLKPQNPIIMPKDLAQGF